MGIIVNLDLVLVSRKMRLKDLARQIGMTEANLSVLKSGNAKAIRFSTLDLICRHLGCHPGDILAYTPHSEQPRKKPVRKPSPAVWS